MVIPYIKNKTTAEQLARLAYWTQIGVEAAEQLYSKPDSGKLKKTYVLNFLKQHGFKVDECALEAFVESAVNALNAGQSIDKEHDKSTIGFKHSYISAVCPVCHDLGFGARYRGNERIFKSYNQKLRPLGGYSMCHDICVSCGLELQWVRFGQKQNMCWGCLSKRFSDIYNRTAENAEERELLCWLMATVAEQYGYAWVKDGIAS